VAKKKTFCKRGHELALTRQISSNGHSTNCGKCKSMSSRQWQIEHPERAKKTGAKWRDANREKSRDYARRWSHANRVQKHFSHVKRAFDITENQYNAMLEKQNGLCAICRGADKNGRRLAVDHDHISGEVRGLLCIKCNVVVGFLNDSPIRIRQLMDYLESWSQLRLIKAS